MDRHSYHCLKLVGRCFGTVGAAPCASRSSQQWMDGGSLAPLRGRSVVVALQQATDPLMRHDALAASRLATNGQDQEAFTRQKAIARVCDVATHLTHPGGVGLRRDPSDLDAAR